MKDDVQVCAHPAILLVMALVLPGCTAFAGKADYADYRVIRMASDERERLLAMQRYTSRHPDGRFYQEIQAERDAREARVFETGKGDRSGLELYLQAYPDGHFANRARSMLEAIGQVEERRRLASERARRLSLQQQQRQELLSRTWIARFTAWWMRALLAIEGWGAPLPEVAHANAGFSRAYGAPPGPRCSRQECVKGFRSRFGVPVPGGTRVEREVRILLRLRLDRGELRRAELLMPERGFSRWYELENQTLVVDEDKENRDRAVSWAFDALQRLLAEGEGELAPRQGVALSRIEAPALDSVPESSGMESDTPDTSDPSPDAGNREAAAGASAGWTRLDARNPFAAGTAAAPDMVMDTLAVPAEGATPPPESSAHMVMEPLRVFREEEAAPVQESKAAEAAGSSSRADASPDHGEPYRVRAFSLRMLRIIAFASRPGQASPAYDGVVIEVAEEGAIP